jgi:integrase/recombinase XerD
MPESLTATPVPGPAPVEYAVAVDRYLDGATLGAASRRVYRISLAGWAWPLVNRETPPGAGRRRAAPPIVPLALLDRPEAAARLAAATAARAAVAGARTVNRELSALRSAVGWWQEQGWISTDPAAGLRHLARPGGPAPVLAADQRARLLSAPADLREHTFWRLLADTGAPAEDVLALNADQLDLAGHQMKPRSVRRLRWTPATSDRLSWLLAGRDKGPVFLTKRKASAGTPEADVCPLTGRARMSYRRAAEIFTIASRSLDPAGHGWTLHQLRPAAPAAA